MEKTTKEDKRNGCLSILGSIYPWNREIEEKELKAEEVTELITVRNKDKSYECGSSIASQKCKKEVIEGKPDQEVVAKSFRDKEEEEEEDGEFRDNSLVQEPSDTNKNISLREEEEEVSYSSGLAFDERLKVVETEKNERSDEKAKVEKSPESVDVDKQAALPNFGAWEAIQLTPSDEDLGNTFKLCSSSTRRRGAISDAFSKVKTFDLKGVIKSSERRD